MLVSVNYESSYSKKHLRKDYKGSSISFFSSFISSFVEIVYYICALGAELGIYLKSTVRR